MDRTASSRITEGSEDDILVSERKRTNYNEHREDAEKPFKERKRIQGRDGETPLRKYHMTAEERKVLISEAVATGGTVNPLKGRVGAYWGQVEALILLGINEYHSLKKVADKMESVMSAMPKTKMIAGKKVETNLWAEFYEKPSRDGATKPKDGMGRILQNFQVLQRLPQPDRFENNPYGIKLSQFGMCIDIENREVSPGIEIPYVRLNTSWPEDEAGVIVKPIMPKNKRRRKAKAEQTEVVVNAEVAEVEAVDEASEIPEKVSDVITDTEAKEALEVAREIMENGESPISEADENGTELNLPPDDFDEQLKNFKAE